MAKNEVYKDANYLSLPVPVGTVSGQALKIGGLNVVAQTDEPTAYLAANPGAYNRAPSSNKVGYASCALIGAWRLPISTTTAMAVGDPVYITSGNVLTPSSSGNSVFGYALSVKGTTAGQAIIVRITN